ncbi:putative cell division control protein [Fusarium oxysporum II5]|nr:putative cell division control protein [Fusarium oxysporum II5]
MPASTVETPAVALSFANNFWGKEDAGVAPLLSRMTAAKTTCDELRAFYGARASIEEEYSRKLLNLSRKALGSQESGTLKTSLDTVRGEVEQMAKQHQLIGAEMKSELEEPLAAFAGGMKERRKIIQNTVEKLLKVKMQQTQQVNKTRDKYEQECLKIKGYLAQGHMVMGQEERRNKAKLEKTQISLATSNTEYENAVKALEDTTTRWNREWKSAADKFQDLEEERLDFTKSSLWTFANIASTVCVSDDSSCEKIRLSLEVMDVEKDIITFITEKGTGQEIPDAPKYINFCRGDVTDNQSETSEDDNYSVAQFPRSINPAFRSSSPQPSTFESHHDPNSALANDLAHREVASSKRDLPAQKPATLPPDEILQIGTQKPQPQQIQAPPQPRQQQIQRHVSYDANQHGAVAAVPHDPYPLDGMTMLCRTGPSPISDQSSQVTSARPSSRDSHSDYSNPNSFSSVEPPSGKTSPVKQAPAPAPAVSNGPSPVKLVAKKKSGGFLKNHSPFRRKSNKDLQSSNRNTWHAPSTQNSERTQSPEPIDANASLALGVGQNVFPVSTPDTKKKPGAATEQTSEETDPIALALAELKGVTLGKQSSMRMSADHYSGLATPAPASEAASRQASASRTAPTPVNPDVAAAKRGTPPPSYQTPVSRLGVPPPAVTSRAMKEATKKATTQTRSIDMSRGGSGIYGSSPGSRPGTRGSDMPRATSPAPARSVSPQPPMNDNMSYRSVSPNPYAASQRSPSVMSSPQKHGSAQGYYPQSPQQAASRGPSPAPYAQQNRPGSSYAGSDMAIQLAPVDDPYGSQRSRGSRPASRAMSYYDDGSTRQRSQSVADPSRLYTGDGRAILHYARALYMYQAAIPEELSFGKGDYLAVLRHQDDGWWEAEVHGGDGSVGLVPSNYLAAC